jgi:hypothetical protein
MWIMKIEVSEKNVQRDMRSFLDLSPTPSQCVLFAMKILLFANNSISDVIMNLSIELSVTFSPHIEAQRRNIESLIASCTYSVT